MVASGVRPWGKMSCCARARSTVCVAQRLAGLLEDVIGGVEVGHGNISFPCELLLMQVSPLLIDCRKGDAAICSSFVCSAGPFLLGGAFYLGQIFEAFRPNSVSADLTCGQLCEVG